MPLWSPPSRGHSVVPLIWSPKPESLQSLKHSRPIPFVSSEVETPIGGARPHGVSTSLDTDGKRDQVRGAPPPVPCHKPAGSRRCSSPCRDRGLAAMQGGKDRKSVVKGKSVSVRVDLGGRRHIKKKKERNSYRSK